MDNGPAVIDGPISVISKNGESYFEKNEKVALCRCGRSGKGIYCDGSHSKSVKNEDN